MNNSESMARKHYRQITDDHLQAGCGLALQDPRGANVGANPTLSETVAFLIESWSRMTPRQKAWVSTLLQPGMENWDD